MADYNLPIRMECSKHWVRAEWSDGQVIAATREDYDAKVAELGDVNAARTFYINLFCDKIGIPESERSVKFLLSLAADGTFGVTIKRG